jgi:hypothetical protein
MRTFPYPLAPASLLAACASTPQPQPEAAPSASAPPTATAASQSSGSGGCGSYGGYTVLVGMTRMIEFLSRVARFLEKLAGPSQASQPR